MRLLSPEKMSTRRQMGVVILHNSADGYPQCALVTKAGGNQSDATAVIYNGISAPVGLYLDSVSIEENSPSPSAGMVRRNASLDIIADGLFTAGSWTQKFYSCGVNQDSFYFSIWTVDAYKATKELTRYGTCYGIFCVDSGMRWAEGNTTVSVNLIDIMLTLDRKLNYFEQDTVDQLVGSELEELVGTNMYWGNFGKAKTVRPKQVSSYGLTTSIGYSVQSYSGNIQSVNLGLNRIGLGKSQFLAENSGGTAKVVLRSGEVISGTITPNGDGTFDLTSIFRNVVWSTVAISANVANTPIDSDYIVNTCVPSSVLEIITTGMYARCALINFFDTTSPGNIPITDKVVRLGTVLDPTTRITQHDDITDPSSDARSGFEVNFQTSTTNSDFTGTADEAFNYAQKTFATSADLFFVDPDSIIPDPVYGDSWVIYVTAGNNTSITSSYTYQTGYIRTLNTTANRVFIRKGEGYIDITTYCTVVGGTFFGINRMIRVQVNTDYNTILGNEPGTAEPTDLDIFVDLYHSVKVDSGIAELFSLLYADYKYLLGYTLRHFLDASPGMIVHAVITTDTDMSNLLDSLLAESGCTFRWRNLLKDRLPRIEIEDTVNSNLRNIFWPDPDDADYAFCKPVTNVRINNDEIVEGSFSQSVGKLDTILDPTMGTERIGAYVEIDYIYNLDTNSSVKLRSQRRRDRKDRYIKQTLNHPVDRNGAALAAVLMIKPGHSSDLAATTRTVSFGIHPGRIDIEANDLIDLVNAKNISETVDAPIFKNDMGETYFRFDKFTKYILTPNLFKVDTINYRLDSGQYSIGLTLKQVQCGNYENLFTSTLFENGTPDPDALPDPVVPEDPPTEDNPVVIPPSVECPGETSGPPLPPPSAPVIVDRDACSVPSCSTPENSGGDPNTNPDFGGVCLEAPHFQMPSLSYNFESGTYTLEEPSLAFKSFIEGYAIIGGSFSVSLGIDDVFSFFDPRLETTPVPPLCSTGAMLAGSIAVPSGSTQAGSFTVTSTCWNLFNWFKDMTITSTILATWISNPATGDLQSTLVTAITKIRVKRLPVPVCEMT